jgi:hypothetical protein
LTPIAGPITDFKIYNDVLYLVGSFTGIRTRAAAFDLAGNLLVWDPNLTGGTGGSANTIFVDSAGVIIGGDFTKVNGASLTRNRIAEFDLVNGVATAFDPNCNDLVNSLTVVGASVYLCGYFTSINGGTTRNRAAAVDRTTGVALAWDPNLDGGGQSVQYYAGNVYVGGGFLNVNGGGLARTAIASFDSTTGVANAGFDAQLSGGFGNVLRIRVAAGEIVAMGSFEQVAGQDARGLAFLNFSSGALIPPEFNFATSGSTAQVYDSATLGTRYFVGGDFNQILGDVQRKNLAGYILGQASQLKDLNVSTDGEIKKVFVKHPSMIFIFGSFSNVTGTNGTFSRTGVASVDADTGDILPFNPVVSGGDVLTGFVFGNVIYIGGEFNDVNGDVRNLAAAVDYLTGATLPWDADISGLGNGVYVFGTDGVRIIIGGSFDTVNGGTTRRGICRVDATTGVVDAVWDPEVTGIADSVYDILNSFTHIYIVGSFDTVGGQPRSSIARVSSVGAGAVDLTWIFDVDTGDDVFSVTIDNFQNIYVGGSFTNINATPQKNIAKITSGGVLDPTWSNTLALDGGVVYEVFGFMSIIYFSGDFTQAGGEPRLGVAFANTPGVVGNFDPNTDGKVNSFAIDFAPSFLSSIYIAGLFSFVGVTPVDFFAVFDVPAPPVTGLPATPVIEFLNRKSVVGEPTLTLFKWKPVVKDEQGNYITIQGYRIYRTQSLNLEDPVLIAEVSSLDIRGFVDTMFTEEIDGFYKYCVSAFNDVGEGGKSCSVAVGLAQSDRI